MATTAAELAPSFRASNDPAFQPDYPDEITQAQLDVIRRMTDPDGNLLERSTVLHAPAW